MNNFKTKLKAIAETLDIPLMIFAATEYDKYRKPCPGMWAEALEAYDLNDAEGFDSEKSFFVGDAAGRKGDHSRVDR